MRRSVPLGKTNGKSSSFQHKKYCNVNAHTNTGIEPKDKIITLNMPLTNLFLITALQIPSKIPKGMDIKIDTPVT